MVIGIVGGCRGISVGLDRGVACVNYYLGWAVVGVGTG